MDNNLSKEKTAKEYKQFLNKLRSTLKPPLPPQSVENLQLYFSDIINYVGRLDSFKEEVENLQKIVLYTWQILNIYYIEMKVSENELKRIRELIEWTYANKYSESCYKNMLICMFNTLKNEKIGFDSQIIRIIIREGSMKQMGQQELEWYVYIVEMTNQKMSGFIKEMCKFICIQTNTKSNFLTFTSNLLAKVIDERSTTEIVSTFVSPIEDVRLMYNKKENYKFKISYQDYLYLLQELLPFFINQYKQYVIKCLQNRNDEQISLNSSSNFMDILSICNSVLFLGGYSPAIQQKTTNIIINKILFLLQLTYLLYSLSNKKINKINVNLNIDFYENIMKLLQCNKIQNKELKQELLINDGQLVSIIRLLSNLIHINKACQQHFQNNLQYFRIILSLTHQSQQHLTMKNWAIIFIKNVSSQSQIMRTQMEKLTINMKVQ